MQYREIVSVTGLGGLFHLITTKSDGAIVRSLTDKAPKFISARKHNITPLESIEIYTVNDNVRLQDILLKMQEAEATTPPVDSKKSSGEEIVSYFKTVFPEIDEERVYVSDMKKMLKWYIQLRDNDLLTFESDEQEEDVDEQEEAKAVEEKPAKKATKKKAPAKKAADDEKEKPVKKTAAKKKAPAKKAADKADKPAKKTAKKKSED